MTSSFLPEPSPPKQLFSNQNNLQADIPFPMDETNIASTSKVNNKPLSRARTKEQSVPRIMKKPSSLLMVILRGLPGSGKTSLATDLVARAGHGVVLSSDDYFVRDGKYEWRHEDLGRAHEFNQERALKEVERKTELVVIDNTNVTAWEMRPYVEMAVRAGYQVKIMEPQTEWSFDARELARRNSHGVDLKTIRNMKDRYESGLQVEDLVERWDLGKFIRSSRRSDGGWEDSCGFSFEPLMDEEEAHGHEGGQGDSGENSFREKKHGKLSRWDKQAGGVQNVASSTEPPNLDWSLIKESITALPGLTPNKNPFDGRNQINPFDRPNQTNPFDRPNQANQFDRPNQVNPFDRPNQVNPFDRPNQVNPFEKPNQLEPFEKPNQLEPFEKPNQLEPFVRPNQTSKNISMLPFGYNKIALDTISFGNNGQNLNQDPPVSQFCDGNQPPTTNQTISTIRSNNHPPNNNQPFGINNQAPPFIINNQAPPFGINNQDPPFGINNQAPPFGINNQVPPLQFSINNQAPPLPFGINNQAPLLPSNINNQVHPLALGRNNQVHPITPSSNNQIPDISALDNSSLSSAKTGFHSITPTPAILAFINNKPATNLPTPSPNTNHEEIQIKSAASETSMVGTEEKNSGSRKKSRWKERAAAFLKGKEHPTLPDNQPQLGSSKDDPQIGINVNTSKDADQEFHSALLEQIVPPPMVTALNVIEKEFPLSKTIETDSPDVESVVKLLPNSNKESAPTEPVNESDDDKSNNSFKTTENSSEKVDVTSEAHKEVENIPGLTELSSVRPFKLPTAFSFLQMDSPKLNKTKEDNMSSEGNSSILPSTEVSTDDLPPLPPPSDLTDMPPLPFALNDPNGLPPPPPSPSAFLLPPLPFSPSSIDLPSAPAPQTLPHMPATSFSPSSIELPSAPAPSTPPSQSASNMTLPDELALIPQPPPPQEPCAVEDIPIPSCSGFNFAITGVQQTKMSRIGIKNPNSFGALMMARKRIKENKNIFNEEDEEISQKSNDINETSEISETSQKQEVTSFGKMDKPIIEKTLKSDEHERREKEEEVKDISKKPSNVAENLESEIEDVFPLSKDGYVRAGQSKKKNSLASKMTTKASTRLDAPEVECLTPVDPKLRCKLRASKVLTSLGNPTPELLTPAIETTKTDEPKKTPVLYGGYVTKLANKEELKTFTTASAAKSTPKETEAKSKHRTTGRTSPRRSSKTRSKSPTYSRNKSQKARRSRSRSRSRSPRNKKTSKRTRSRSRSYSLRLRKKSKRSRSRSKSIVYSEMRKSPKRSRSRSRLDNSHRRRTSGSQSRADTAERRERSERMRMRSRSKQRKEESRSGSTERDVSNRITLRSGSIGAGKRNGKNKKSSQKSNSRERASKSRKHKKMKSKKSKHKSKSKRRKEKSSHNKHSGGKGDVDSDISEESDTEVKSLEDDVENLENLVQKLEQAHGVTENDEESLLGKENQLRRIRNLPLPKECPGSGSESEDSARTPEMASEDSDDTVCGKSSPRGKSSGEEETWEELKLKWEKKLKTKQKT